MKLMKILILLLLVKINSSDDTSPTTQYEPHSCGQLKLNEVKKVKKCWFFFCDYSYELRFYNLTTTDDDTIHDTVNNTECIICPDPYDKEGEYTTMVRYEFKLFAAQPKPCQSSDTLALLSKFSVFMYGRSLGFPSVIKKNKVACSQVGFN